MFYLQRFQKTYEALEQEGLAEKKQLVALHQQRVQASLNDKKRHAMEHYMEVLTESAPEVTISNPSVSSHYYRYNKRVFRL